MSHGHMQMSDAMNMNVHHHHHHHHPISTVSSEQFDNVLNLNMNNDYHQFGTDYWNSSYKNGSTPMKEMEGELTMRFNEFHSEFKTSCCQLTRLSNAILLSFFNTNFAIFIEIILRV